MKLYEIAEALQNEENYINMETGEIDIELLNNLSIAYDEKVDSICTMIAELDNEIGFITAEIERLKDKVKSKQKRIEAFKSYLTFCIPDKWKNARYSVSIRTNQSVDADLDKIPEEYKRVTTKVEIDKKKIGDVLKNGGTVEGATLKTSRSATIK